MRIVLYAILLVMLFAGSGYYMAHPELWPGGTMVIEVTGAIPDAPPPLPAATSAAPDTLPLKPPGEAPDGA
ncbi:MAG: hypothetical protein KJO38_03430, partial [Gammaproteobacteria bacterium]|nr:hypothetical protein [Gammaproteobacteria bacterium]